jgi:hypothetical protein
MKYLFLITIISFSGMSQAQTTEDSVKASVNQLFTAMKNADSSLLAASFADSAVLQTVITDKEGRVKVENESVSGFAGTIGKLQKDIADERIEFDVIRIDGSLAMVWAPYKFYYKGKFSHCGVDSFQFIRLKGKWRIQYLIDTRRKQSCE